MIVVICHAMTQIEAQILTILIEMSLVCLFRLWSEPLRKLAFGRIVLSCLAVNLISHPLAWDIFQWLLQYEDYWIIFSVVEIAVVVLEGELYTFILRVPRKISYGLSFSANFVSAFSNFVF